MEKVSIQKKTNAVMLDDISLEIKSILTQTREIRNDLSYIKAHLSIKNKIDKAKEENQNENIASSWWWG